MQISNSHSTVSHSISNSILTNNIPQLLIVIAVTKQTQWEKPAVLEQSSAQFGAYGDNEARQEELPSNWEEMHDPTTGKPFYVDHERKITQWTRPEVQRQASTNTFSYAPASPSFAPSVNTPSRAAPSNVAKSYFQEASYFQHSVTETTHDVDFSDSLPKIDFSVKKVADKFRSECPNCDGKPLRSIVSS